MANFIPLKNYMFYCLEQMIDHYQLQPPFLDVGCGIGDLSCYLAGKNWQGKSIDFSETAIEKAQKNLKKFPLITVKNKSLFEEKEKFKTILMWDILEHLEEDEIALQKIHTLLLEGGHLLLAIPSNPSEWRWDDDFYGHYRRYSAQDISDKLIRAGFKPIIFWDFTYPVFWIMRRIYTQVKSRPKILVDKEIRTRASSTVNAWDIPWISFWVNQNFFLWNIIYKIQFSWFKNKVNKGHEMFVLAQKISEN
jgi:SAM-dependent methyltransferase